jgi:hypothetical protein
VALARMNPNSRVPATALIRASKAGTATINPAATVVGAAQATRTNQARQRMVRASWNTCPVSLAVKTVVPGRCSCQAIRAAR